jgi:GT2 family glycosyltransferase
VIQDFAVYEPQGRQISQVSASLLICSRNRPQLLWESIESILAGNEIPSELIIVDQSDQPDPHLSKYQPEQDCEFRYIWSEKKGVSLGRNMAATAANHSILVFTDDDMLVSPTWFGKLVRSLAKAGSSSVVTGQVLVSEDNGVGGYAPSIRDDEQVVIYQGRVNRDVLFTNNMAIYRSTFDRIGGFDIRLGPGTIFPAAEDNDFAFQLLESGCQIIYDPLPTLYHRAWRSKGEFLRLYWNYGCGQGAFYAKYFNLRDSFMIKRMVRDIYAYMARFPRRFWQARMQAYQDGLYVAGLLFGALKWGFLSLKKRP